MVYLLLLIFISAFAGIQSATIELPVLSSESNGADIIVIGDIHSDYDHFERILHNSGMMDASGTWAGSNSKLVLLGDYVQGLRPDSKRKVKGFPNPDADKKILDTIARLASQALVDGGEVIPIQGNHDLMQILGVGQEYVAPGQDTSEFELTHKYGQQIMAMPVLRKIGKLLFTHGGICCLENVVLDGTVDPVLQKLQEQNLLHLQNNELNMSKYPLQHDRCDKSVLSRELLDKLGVEHVIVGHTPGHSVRHAQGGKLIVVDSTISRAFGDYGEGEYQRGSHLLLPRGNVELGMVHYNTDVVMKVKKLRKQAFYQSQYAPRLLMKL